MSEFGSERSKQWNIYPSSEPSPSQAQVDREGQWKNFGTSMSAISFGFVATAILISMFLIMALFEHLFKPTPSFSSSQDISRTSSLEAGPMQKIGSSQPETVMHSADYTVLMPGQQYPTFIAHPTPLPCQREGAYWPSHEHNFGFP